MPDEVLVNGQPATISEELAYAMGTNLTEGLGLMGAAYLGQRVDYITGAQDPEDESINLGFNFTTFTGGSGLLVEAGSATWTGGVAGFVNRVATYNKIIRDLNKAGLLTDAAKDAAYAAMKADQVNAMRRTVTAPIRIITPAITKPIEFAAAKTLGKELQLTEGISNYLGKTIKADDPAAVAIMNFIQDIPNQTAGQAVLDIMTRTQRDLIGIGSVDELRAWFRNNGFTVDEYDQFVIMAESLGKNVTDDWIKNWPKEIPEIEIIAAARVRSMGQNAPPSLRESLLGTESPLDVAMEVATMPGTTKTANPLSNVADQMRTEAFLQHTATKKVTDAMLTGNWDISRYKKLSDTLFTDPAVRAEAIKRVEDTIGETINEILASGKAGGIGDDIVLTPEQKKKLFDYFIGDFRGTGDLQSGTWIEHVTGSSYSQSTKEVLLSTIANESKPFTFTNKHFDAMTQDALTLEARGRGIPRKAIDDAIESMSKPPSTFGDVVGAIAEPLKAFEGYKRTERGRYYKSRTYENAFKASELESGMVRKYFASVGDALGLRGAIPNSAVDEVANIIRNHMGAGDEEFKYRIRVRQTQINPFTNEKYTRRDAWIRTIMDEYLWSSNRSKREILLSEGKDLYRADDATRFSDTQGDYDNFFNDYLTQIFGGSENISHTILSTGGKATHDLRPLAPDQVLGLMDALSEVSPMMKDFKNQFRKAMEAGDLENAMNVIVGLHMEMQGKTLNQMLSFDDFVRLLDESPDLGKIVDRSGLYTKQAIIDNYADAEHLTPYFKPEDTQLIQSHIYTNKRVSNGIEMGYDHLLNIAGDSVFPSEKVLTMSAQSDAPNRIWFTHELMQRAGLQPSAQLINDFHLRFTDASIRKGISSTLQSGYNRATVTANKDWQRLSNEFVEQSIGARPQNNIPAATRWDVDAQKIKQALDDAYINDSNSPFSKYWNGISDTMTAKNTPEYKKNLIYGLESAFRRSRTTEQGIIPTSRFPAEQLNRLPMPLNEASTLQNDLNAALSLERRGSAKQKIGIMGRFAPKTALESAEIPAHKRKQTQEAQRAIEAKERQLAEFNAKTPPDSPDQIRRTQRTRTRLQNELQSLRSQFATAPYVVQGDAAPVLDFMDYVIGRVADQARVTKNFDNATEAKEAFGFLIDSLNFTYRASWNTNRFVKGSVLGGFYAVNPGYLTMNEGSAQLIISSTVGAKYAKPLNLNARKVVAYAHGTLTDTAADIIVTSPVTGKVYRTADLAQIAYGTSLSRGQANAELAGNMAETFAKYAGSDPESLKALKRANFKGNEALSWIEKNLSKAPQSVQDAWQYIRRNILTTDINLFNQLASASDTVHRMGVFIEAIRLGKTEAEAIKLAQKSLHDYNSLLPWEKATFSRAVWFWTFARNQMLTTFRNLLENPNRVSLGSKLARDWREDKAKLPKEEYYLDRAVIDVLHNEETQEQFLELGIPLPTAGSVKEAITWLAPLAPFLDDNKTFNEASLDSIQQYAHTLAGRTNPIAAWGATMFADREYKFGEVRDYSNFVDPNIVFLASKHKRVNEYLHGLVPMTAKDPDKITDKHMSYDGQVYEIATEQGKRNYARLMHELKFAGASRLITEYAPMWAALNEHLGTTDRDLEQTPIKMTTGDPARDAARVLFGLKHQTGRPQSVEEAATNAIIREINEEPK